ncbi:MarR family winged helix-turn-helix transcriptional regulator [Gordonia sp. CPCC 206044]|uniref:MarR family winged helix-turn-helix transcriptional regulator n=1 Tax=Gordonia sp. CPCC 206044 TaxID=3140793 RepID=UPI003AF38A6C
MARADDLPDLPDDFARFWFLLRRVGTLMDRSGEALFRQGLGISLAQFLVLSTIDAFPNRLNQQMIADRLGLTKSTVSRQVDNGVSAGLITVSAAAHSRRDNEIALTEAGTEMVRRGDEMFAQARADFPTISERDMAVTLRTLATFDEAFGESR